MANSAVHRASELLNTVRTRLESPGPMRRNPFAFRRSSSADRANVNFNNAEQNSYETCSMQTTSTSSSAHSGFLNFVLPTTVNQNDPLPQPTCRLGAFQAEWLGGPNATWRLVTQDATMSPLDQADAVEPDLKTLIRANRALKSEQKYLQTKVNVLYDELAKRTALVHSNERRLEKLRNKVSQRMPEHSMESMLSDIRRQMERKLEVARLEKGKTDPIILTTDDETDFKVRKQTLDVPGSRVSDWEVTDEEADKTERKPHRNRTGRSAEQPEVAKRRVEWSEDTNESSVYSGNGDSGRKDLPGRNSKQNSDNSNRSTDEEEEDVESEVQDTIGEDSQSGILHASESESNAGESEDASDTHRETADETADDDDDGEMEETSEDGEETEEDECGKEQELEEEEEDLSKTDESSKTEGRLSSRPRVVQFGKVSRR